MRARAERFSEGRERKARQRHCRIYFYRLERADAVLSVLPGELARIMNLPFGESGRYLEDAEDHRLAAWPDTVEYPLRLRFGRTRLSNLPTKERAGKLEPLDLAVDEGLVELCHIIIYEDGFVAAEFNFEGPRIGRLGEYPTKRNQLITLNFCLCSRRTY
jgi:hypothetical protein